jgi:phosphatidylglycerophosphatase C
MNLALFDFDGTLTHHDTFSPFLRFSASRRRELVGSVVLGPMILGYKLGLVSAGRLRAAGILACFYGRSASEVASDGLRYAETLSERVHETGWERLRWHREQGDRIVVVSASLEVYLRPWCEAQGLDLIGAELESRDGLLTGRYHRGDCAGEAKAERVRARYELAQFPVIYAYGDSPEDRPLLGLAHRAFFRWREVPPAR